LSGPKVLLIRLSSLGDVVLATAAVEALAARLPEAAIHVLTKPEFREVFASNPAVAALVEWAPGDCLAALARKLRAERYDRIVDLHANLRTRLLRPLVPGARWSVYPKGALRRRLAVKLRRPGLLDSLHVTERYAAALAPLGVPVVAGCPRIHLTDAERSRAHRALREAGWDGARPLLALAPGARWPTKAWPEAKWRECLETLRRDRDLFPLAVGGKGEVGLCGRILAGMAGADFAGRTTIRETAALLSHAAALLTNDSAALHLASALDVPVVALFGPTTPGFGFAPRGPRDRVIEIALPCRPCSLHGGSRCPENHFRCFSDLSPDIVAGAVEEVLYGEGRG
jgi:ADP-heptose:LPS heptosyltransferase